MKKIYFLTILSLSFYFLNAQDIIYTITGEINQQTTSIDSILVENISNNTRILFGDLPVLPDYNINLTQQSFWGATGIGTFKKDKGFFIKSNYPGMMVLACDYNRPLLTGISIYNTNGQKIYDFQKREISAGSSINIHLGRVGLYVVKIMTPFGVQTFKAIGSSQQKNDNLFVNITGQSGFMQGFKSTTVATNDGFSFSTGDSIRISIYKQNYYAYPAVLKITGSLSISFIFNKSSGTLTDPRDGQTYNLVTIGSQTWMAENLNYDTTNSWWYDNDSANGDIYGRLYTWDAALNACPSGWHLPSNVEWKTLEMALGMSQSEADNTGWRGTDEGGKMKEAGTAHWNSPNTGATNSSGFTALPGGLRYSNGSFGYLGSYGYWWSSTEYSGTNAWYRLLNYYNAQVYRYSYNKTYGFSVRCLKN